jgi:ABC-2 type transport system permease protein
MKLTKKNSAVRQSLRIILAITSKDIQDAIRNKTILSLLISALFLSMFFTIMPMLNKSSTPLVFLADAGQSSYTKLIIGSETLRVRWYPSVEEMKLDFIRRADNQFALVLPADFDQILAEGSIPKIQGFVLNWVSNKTISEKIINVQTRLTKIIGSPVYIDLNGGTLYMSPESNGGFLEATGIVIILLITGMLFIPNLMLEEKRTRTMDALLISPASINQIAISKTLTGLFYVLIFAIMVVLANGYLVVQWNLLFWSILFSILVAVSIGLLLGILIEHRQHLTILSQVLLIPLVLPILLRIFGDLVPGWLADVARWMPSSVMFDLLRISFSDQSDPVTILPRLGLLVFYFMILFGISTWLIQRLESKPGVI